MVSKTVDTKMLQTVMNNDISFGKVVAHDQLSHLLINKNNHVAMATIFKNPKWRASAQVSDFIYLKKNSKTTESNYKHEFSKKNY